MMKLLLCLFLIDILLLLVVFGAAARKPSKIDLLNFLVLQWFGLRIEPQYDSTGKFSNYYLDKKVWPLTRWFTPDK